MNIEEDKNNLKAMLIDFEEYSTDYTKTRCKELEETIENTLGYIHNLEQENKQPKVLCELIEELPYGIQRDIDAECYFIDLCGYKTPLLISNELQEQIEFQIMTQEDYERMEKEKMFKKFDKMFFQY